MKFSELLNTQSVSIQKSFLLGQIYAWPVFTQDFTKILAYSSYKHGSRSEEALTKSIDEYFSEHKTKLQNFLGPNFFVEYNEILKETYVFTDRVGQGVSTLIDFDLEIPPNLEPTIYVYGLIEKCLIDVGEEQKNMFFTGVMNARTSPDFSGRYITIDVARNIEPEITKRKLSKYNDIIGGVFNYNPRLTQPEGDVRNDQFRINMDFFIGKFGLFIPFKIDYYKFERPEFQEENKYGYFFTDKKFANVELPINSSDRNSNIIELSIKLKKDNLTEEEKNKIIEDYREEYLVTDTEDELLYSSQNMKETCKIASGFVCEYGGTAHNSFSARSNSKNYVEAHHLIPFSERQSFEVSIDVLPNLVSLCPNCHRKIHLAVDQERKEFISTLFERRKEGLKSVGIEIDINKLFGIYRVVVN